MTAMAVGRRAIAPRVTRGQIAEQFIVLARDERRFSHLRRLVARRADEARVLVLGDWKATNEEFAEMHAVHGTLVLSGVGGSHEEVASRNPRERWRGRKRQGRVSILFLRGERLLERRRIVAANHVVADDGDRNRAQAAGKERIVGAIVLVDVHHGKRGAGA